jgi:hypothetical protein
MLAGRRFGGDSVKDLQNIFTVCQCLSIEVLMMGSCCDTGCHVRISIIVRLIFFFFLEFLHRVVKLCCDVSGKRSAFVFSTLNSISSVKFLNFGSSMWQKFPSNFPFLRTVLPPSRFDTRMNPEDGGSTFPKRRNKLPSS